MPNHAMLSSPNHLLTALLTSLQTIPPPNLPSTTTTTSTSISSLSHLPTHSQQKAKSVLLTLHFLFPHELLPALDILDRRLVTRLYTSPTSSSPETTVPAVAVGSTSATALEVYYVQSASTDTTTVSRTGRFRNAVKKPGLFYEVRLEGWNCTCPAFAFNSLKLVMKDGNLGAPVERQGDSVQRPSGVSGTFGNGDGNGEDWLMGGLATRHDATMPICKHILAVALGRSGPGVFGAGVVEQEVSRDAIAGWAAGWGEN